MYDIVYILYIQIYCLWYDQVETNVEALDESMVALLKYVLTDMKVHNFTRFNLCYAKFISRKLLKRKSSLNYLWLYGKKSVRGYLTQLPHLSYMQIWSQIYGTVLGGFSFNYVPKSFGVKRDPFIIVNKTKQIAT